MNLRLLFASTTVLVLSACGLSHEASSVPTPQRQLEPIAAPTTTATEHSAMAYEAVVGTIVAREEARIASKLPGTIRELPVQLGSQVAAGDRLLRIDAEEIAAQLRQAEAQRDQAEKDLARFEQLLEQKAVARREFDAVATRAQVARQAVEQARAMLSYSVIDAPFAGVITRKTANVGDLAMPGQPLLVLADPNDLRLEAALPERVIEHLETGMQLRVSVGEATYTATVAEIAPSADPLSRTVLVKCDLPRNPQLRIGRFARLQVPIGERRALRIPASALLRRGQLEMVFVADQGQARMRLVRSGRRDGEQIEILSGLQHEETILAAPPASIVDGQPLQPTSGS